MKRNSASARGAQKRATAGRTPSQSKGGIEWKIFNEHDTPPPVLFMQGSCILEVGEPKSRDKEEAQTLAKMLLAGTKAAAFPARPFIAHVKIVDGSGDKLYHFDNNNKQSLEITLRLIDGDKRPAGEMVFTAQDGGLSLMLPIGKTLAYQPDKAMNPNRLRFNCVDELGATQTHITAVQVSKLVEAGSIDLYDVAFGDLHSLGVELKVMLWFEDLSRTKRNRVARRA